MAPDDPGAAHAAPELAALLAAREDELRAVEASAAARTLDTKVRAKQFFDDVVEKMRAGARRSRIPISEPTRHQAKTPMPGEAGK